MEKGFQIAPNRVPHHKVVQFIETGIFSVFQLVDKETKKNELLKRKAGANTPLPSNVFFHQELCRRLLHTHTHTDMQEHHSHISCQTTSYPVGQTAPGLMQHVD